MKLSRSVVIASALAGSFALAACSGTTTTQSASDTSASGSSSSLNVMASFYPLKYLTEEIGGDLVKVTSLTPDGAEPHDLELSPATVDQLGKADAVVYLGSFQSAVDEAVEHNAPETVIDVAKAVQQKTAITRPKRKKKATLLSLIHTIMKQIMTTPITWPRAKPLKKLSTITITITTTTT